MPAPLSFKNVKQGDDGPFQGKNQDILEPYPLYFIAPSKKNPPRPLLWA